MKLYLIVIIAFSNVLSSYGQSKTRIYLNPDRGQADPIGVSTADSTLYLSPSLSIDLFVIENQTGQYKIGAIPGIGYGLKWNPFGWDKASLIGIDVFAQAGLSEENESHSSFDYFNIDVLPVVTLFGWVGVGYGPRFKVGLEGLPNKNRTIFSFGIRRSF